MLTGEIGQRLPESATPAMLVLGPAVTGGLLFYFWRRGDYPELAGFAAHASGAWQDVAVGLLLAVLWMAPLLLGVDVFLGEKLWSGLAPPEPGSGFDPLLLGESYLPAVLGLRLLGFALVTPIFEELFLRSFVMRVADVFSERGDFRRVPIARYTRKSFWVVTILFTATHLPWEWIVAVPWVVLSSLWFYRRGHIGAVVLLHATTNAAILAFVVGMGGELRVGGRLIDLWIFV